MRLIDADKLKEIFEADREPYEMKWCSQAIITEIEDAPTVEAVTIHKDVDD